MLDIRAIVLAVGDDVAALLQTRINSANSEWQILATFAGFMRAAEHIRAVLDNMLQDAPPHIRAMMEDAISASYTEAVTKVAAVMNTHGNQPREKGNS